MFSPQILTDILYLTGKVLVPTLTCSIPLQQFHYWLIPNLDEQTNKVVKDYLLQDVLPNTEKEKSFYGSWQKVEKTSQQEYWFDVEKHYVTVYINDVLEHFNIDQKLEIYLPRTSLMTDEKEQTSPTVPVKILEVISLENLKQQLEQLLTSGIAIKTTDVVRLCRTYHALFNIKDLFTLSNNKEANAILCLDYGRKIQNNEEIMRTLVYLITGQTLVIKNLQTNHLIDLAFTVENGNELLEKEAKLLALLNKNIQQYAEIYNRYKPIFLQLRKTIQQKTQNTNIVKAINRIARLSKTQHQPMAVNKIKNATSYALTTQDLQKATVWALLSCYSGLKAHLVQLKYGYYYIRNGSVFYKQKAEVTAQSLQLATQNLVLVIDAINQRISTKKVFLPDNVEYGLPTSLKSFIGHFPNSTSLLVEVNDVIGIYWKDKQHKRTDLDLSAINIMHKVGWNGDKESHELHYSGDLTSAPHGAIEGLKLKVPFIKKPYLVLMNAYTGADSDFEYKIFIAKHINQKRDSYAFPKLEWMNENLKGQNILGVLKGNRFYLTNADSGNLHIGSYDAERDNAFVEKVSTTATLRGLLEQLPHIEIVNQVTEADIDLSSIKVSKQDFLAIFN